MQIQYLKTLAGPDSKKNANAGEVREVPTKEAKDLIKAGIAAPVGSVPKETADSKKNANSEKREDS